MSTTTTHLPKGAEWLITPTDPTHCFTPEDFQEEQIMVKDMCSEFIEAEILPLMDRIDKLEPGLMPSLMDKAGELGLLGTVTPESLGGLGKDFITGTLINEALGGAYSFSVAVAAHTGIGTLPILYFGTLVRKKGFLDLAEIFNQVVAENSHARLRIIGRDAADTKSGARSTFEMFEQSLSDVARRKIEYLGALPYSGMSDQIRKAALCVFPSYAEAMPLAWLEAMALGKAVIAYDIGWAPEAIEGGVSGELVPLGDVSAFASKILELIGDNKRCHDLGQIARQRVEERFSSEVIAEQSLKWYREVIKQYFTRGLS